MPQLAKVEGRSSKSNTLACLCRLCFNHLLVVHERRLVGAIPSPGKQEVLLRCRSETAGRASTNSRLLSRAQGRRRHGAGQDILCDRQHGRAGFRAARVASDVFKALITSGP